jgi:hypothetical protein
LPTVSEVRQESAKTLQQQGIGFGDPQSAIAVANGATVVGPAR